MVTVDGLSISLRTAVCIGQELCDFIERTHRWGDDHHGDNIMRTTLRGYRIQLERLDQMASEKIPRGMGGE
jgi:hypothetical protein